VYAAQTVTSSFRNGRFTQRIAGTLRPLIDPVDITASLRGPAVSRDFDTTDESDAETNRLVNANERAARNATDTLEAPQYTDPAGTSDASAIINAASGTNSAQPRPKAGATVVSDDAASGVDILGNNTGF
jgi:hypothetical protein